MVLGLLATLAAVPTIIGVNEATKGTQDHEKKRKEDARKQRSHIIAQCEVTATAARYRQQIHGAYVVLKDGFFYLEKPLSEKYHPFTGAYYNHPLLAPNNMQGLVTTIAKDPPLLRWAFVDAETFQVRYGSKQESENHIIGPWDWTPDENSITLEGWEGFLAIWKPDEERWQLYFDHNDDGCNLPTGTRGVEISLRRIMADA